MLILRKQHIFRTPVRWLKFRPEKPMGEILEEGDKDDEQKKEGGDGQEGTEKITTEKKEAGNEDAAAIRDVSAYVNNSDHTACIYM